MILEIDDIVHFFGCWSINKTDQFLELFAEAKTDSFFLVCSQIGMLVFQLSLDPVPSLV